MGFLFKTMNCVMVNCLFLDDDVPLRTSNEVYILRLNLKKSRHVTDFESNKYAMTRNWSNQNPHSAQKPKRETPKITNSKIQREHMVDRVSSSLPKGGHLAT